MPRHVDELPLVVGQATGEDSLRLARQVATQGITHLDRRPQCLDTLAQHVLEILAGVLPAAEEQGDPSALAASYFWSPTPSRVWAVKTLPQRLQRSF